MSRQAHLPPRCPFQKKTISRHDPALPTLDNHIYLHTRHHKSVSQSSIGEEKPAWLDDLLDDSDSNSGYILHRRSASDSLTLLDDHVPLASINQLSGSDTPASCESDGSLESASIYGPNSPRAKGKISFPENAIVSALSEYVSHEHLWHLNDSICASGAANLESVEDTRGSAGEMIAETKPVKRYPGQRSRVRKLQYIAELERTVNILQKVEMDMASKVASLVRQRLALSLENNKLKQRALRLQHEKQIVDGQYKSLRKEVERLKTYLAHAHGSKVSTNFSLSSHAELASAEATWQMLDMGKLDLS
ncbi:unnamed protein product [Coffea canephora]|uniref:BZIP domain-containing protein n=1 Tax=Coffea canephora TaxID=49390 RepID=A0A068TUK6_COFCA|nr:unnamed protein product [Coffea canephora]